jgi:hypothetical protein
MRNLHARDDYGGGGARQEADARADSHRAGGQPLSVHGVLGDLSVYSQRLGCTAKVVHNENTAATKDTKYERHETVKPRESTKDTKQDDRFRVFRVFRVFRGVVLD